MATQTDVQTDRVKPGDFVWSIDHREVCVVLQVTPDWCVCKTTDGKEVKIDWMHVAVFLATPDCPLVDETMLASERGGDPFYEMANILHMAREMLDARIDELAKRTDDIGDVAEQVGPQVYDHLGSAICELDAASGNIRREWLAGQLAQPASSKPRKRRTAQTAA